MPNVEDAAPKEEVKGANGKNYKVMTDMAANIESAGSVPLSAQRVATVISAILKNVQNISRLKVPNEKGEYEHLVKDGKWYNLGLVLRMISEGGTDIITNWGEKNVK